GTFRASEGLLRSRAAADRFGENQRRRRVVRKGERAPSANAERESEEDYCDERRGKRRDGRRCSVHPGGRFQSPTLRFTFLREDCDSDGEVVCKTARSR